MEKQLFYVVISIALLLFCSCSAKRFMGPTQTVCFAGNDTVPLELHSIGQMKVTVVDFTRSPNVIVHGYDLDKLLDSKGGSIGNLDDHISERSISGGSRVSSVHTGGSIQNKYLNNLTLTILRDNLLQASVSIVPYENLPMEFNQKAVLDSLIENSSSDLIIIADSIGFFDKVYSPLLPLLE